GTLLFSLKAFSWLIDSTASLRERALTGFVVFGVAGALAVAFLAWVGQSRAAYLGERQPRQVSTPPVVAFLIQNHQLQMHNRGAEEIALWGNKFADDGPVQMDGQPRMVGPGVYYYFEFAEFEQ